MKTALITGVGRGIGKALAQRFLGEGWQVIGTSTNGTVAYVHERLSVYALDLASPKSIEAFALEMQKTNTKFDVYINNAGVLLDDEETVLLPDKLRDTLEVNVIGTAALTEQMLPYMAPGGHLVFISSSAGSLERTGSESHWPNYYPAYKISKAALNMYMRTLAGRLKGEHLIVSSVHPGWVKTDMGGEEADMSPEEAAQDIYAFAISSPATGGFWFKGEPMLW